jgi:hypothetical protein
MRRIFLLLLAIAVIPWLMPDAAFAQYSKYRHRAPDSNTEGLFLQGHLSGASVEVESNLRQVADEDGSGGGLGIKVGYGFTPVFTLYAGLDVAALDNFNPGIFGIDDEIVDPFFNDEVGYLSFDLGTQLNLGAGRNRLVPYLDLALSYSGIVYELNDNFFNEDITVSGAGVSLGGGLKYFLSPTVALDISLTGTASEFEDVTIDGDEFDIPGLEFDTRAARFGFGIAWYPSR